MGGCDRPGSPPCPRARPREVIDGEPTLHRRLHRLGFDHGLVPGVVDRAAQIPGAVSGISVPLARLVLGVKELLRHRRIGVLDARGLGKCLVGDDPGLRLGGHVRPISVPARFGGLAGMPRIRVHRGHNPAGGHLAGDAPPPIGAVRSLRRFYILPGDQRQQRQRPLRHLVPLVLIDLGERREQRVRVVDQRRDQRVLRAGLVPVDPRLTRAAVIVPSAHRRDRLGRTRHQTACPPDRRNQLGDRVLGSDRVGQDRGIHRTFAAPTQDPGLLDHLPHRLVDPMRQLRLGQSLTPIHQRRGIKSLMVQRHSGRDLPPQITPGRLSSLPIRVIMQRLQHQDRSHHRRWDRGTPLARGKQILELPVREHIQAMLGQEREHAARRHQMPDQSLRIQKLPISTFHTLHEPILPAQPHTPRRHTDYSAAS